MLLVRDETKTKDVNWNDHSLVTAVKDGVLSVVEVNSVPIIGSCESNLGDSVLSYTYHYHYTYDYGRCDYLHAFMEGYRIGSTLQRVKKN